MRRYKLAIFLLITVVWTGCGVPDGELLAPDEGLSEIDLPAPIGTARVATGMTPFQPRVQWSDNGNTIHYLPNVGPPFGVHTHDIASGAVEVVAPGSGWVLHVSGDREFLYYSTGLGPHAIYQQPVAGGQPELLATEAGHVFAISRNRVWLAWQSAHVDSIYLRNLDTGGTTAVAAAGAPLSVSPDGLHIVHHSGRGPVVLSVATGVSTDLERVGQRVLDARWAATGVEVLVASIGTLEVLRPGEGDPVPIWTGPSNVMVSTAAWSPDGSRVVASLHGICLTTCQSKLVLIDPATRTETVLATAMDFIGMARFTPDGRTIAVTSGGSLYAVPLPDA